MSAWWLLLSLAGLVYIIVMTRREPEWYASKNCKRCCCVWLHSLRGAMWCCAGCKKGKIRPPGEAVSPLVVRVYVDLGID